MLNGLLVGFPAKRVNRFAKISHFLPKISHFAKSIFAKFRIDFAFFRESFFAGNPNLAVQKLSLFEISKVYNLGFQRSEFVTKPHFR